MKKILYVIVAILGITLISATAHAKTRCYTDHSSGVTICRNNNGEITISKDTEGRGEVQNYEDTSGIKAWRHDETGTRGFRDSELGVEACRSDVGLCNNLHQ